MEVDTLCGPAVACGADKTPVALRDPAGGGAPLAHRCWTTLREVADRLEEGGAPAEPSFGLASPFDPSDTCARPGLSEQARAALRILERVRREGRDRAGSPELKAELDRFDFTEMRASCKGEGFLLEVSSDAGAPGALPYDGIWRIRGPAIEPIYELFDARARSRVWSAGDLDGDGRAELLVRRPIGPLEREDPVTFLARYDVIRLASVEAVEVSGQVRVSQPLDGEEEVRPPVRAVALPSGDVVVVDGVPHRLASKALVAKPGWRAELDQLDRAAERLRGRLWSPPPEGWHDGDPCRNPVRRNWARRVAPTLGRAIGSAGAVVPLAGLWACPEVWRL